MTRHPAIVACLTVTFTVGMGLLIGEEPVSVVKPVPAEAPAEVAGQRAPGCQKDLWLGIEVSRPAPAVHAQLKGVPRGVGFVIDAVVPGGPAAKGGLQDYDFVWKLDDQLLVNTAQFWTLLNLHEEGDVVSLTIQRGGQDQVVDLEMEVRPDDHRGQDRADTRIMAPRIPGLPLQIHDLLGRVAELSDGQGTVRIWRREEGFAWAEYDEFGLELQSGVLRELSEDAFPPDIDAGLKGKLEALIRGYQKAERTQRVDRQQPRVRRVPIEPAGDEPRGAAEDR